jgi:hypothetical protein
MAENMKTLRNDVSTEEYQSKPQTWSRHASKLSTLSKLTKIPTLHICLILD